MNNLRIVSHQENQFNKNAKRYTKQGKKFQAHICLNYKQIRLGYFDNEEEARNAYLEAKKIYHIIE